MYRTLYYYKLNIRPVEKVLKETLENIMKYYFNVIPLYRLNLCLLPIKKENLPQHLRI